MIDFVYLRMNSVAEPATEQSKSTIYCLVLLFIFIDGKENPQSALIDVTAAETTAGLIFKTD